MPIIKSENLRRPCSLAIFLYSRYFDFLEELHGEVMIYRVKGYELRSRELTIL